jgi:hypothetical protein
MGKPYGAVAEQIAATVRGSGAAPPPLFSGRPPAASPAAPH